MEPVATESTRVPTAPCSATRSRCANHTPTPKMLSRSSGLDCDATIIACGAWSGNQSAEQLRWTPCSSPCLDRPAHVHVGSTRWDEKLMQDELHIGVQRARQLLAGHWTITVGDSTARFFFAALLSALNGTERKEGFPLHTLAPDDACSMQRSEWVSIARSPQDAQCKYRWRGNCEGYSKNRSQSISGCVLDVHLHGSRHTYIWSTYLTDEDSINRTVAAVVSASAESFPTRKAPIILHTGGWWDIKNFNHVLRPMSIHSRATQIANGTARLLRQLVSSVAHFVQHSPLMIELELSCCSQEEARLTLPVRTNVQRQAELEGFIVLPRVPSMLNASWWPNNPCHHSHPFGVMSDLHVQAVLIGLQHDQRGVKES